MCLHYGRTLIIQRTQIGIKFRQRLLFGGGVEPEISRRFPYRIVILLFRKTIIILAAGPAPAHPDMPDKTLFQKPRSLLHLVDLLPSVPPAHFYAKNPD
jgi:hypothetical protein